MKVAATGSPTEMMLLLLTAEKNYMLDSSALMLLHHKSSKQGVYRQGTNAVDQNADALDMADSQASA
jgi:hypothetical protein